MLATGCGDTSWSSGSDDVLSGQITVTGSSTIAPLVAEIAARFEAHHPNMRINVQTGGSSRGVSDARRGLADIGMASRTLRDDETDLQAHVIARDGIAMIVHTDNPVRALTAEQVVGIFTGAITNWLELGGESRAITVVNKADGRATLELFLSYFKMAAGDIKPSIVIGENLHGVLTVAGDRGALGYVSIGTAVVEAGRGTAIRPLPLDRIEPTLENVGNGSFGLARPLLLVTRGDRSTLVRAFIDFAQSDAVHDLVEGQAFVPVAR